MAISELYSYSKVAVLDCLNETANALTITKPHQLQLNIFCYVSNNAKHTFGYTTREHMLAGCGSGLVATEDVATSVAGIAATNRPQAGKSGPSISPDTL
eukprot:1646189-Amphidinium_carterae.1